MKQELNILGLKRSTDVEVEAYNLFYEELTSRIISPHTPNAESEIKSTIKNWNENGIYWGFYTGVFDLQHSNHFWAVIRAKIEIAKSYANICGINFNELDTNQKTQLVVSDKIAMLMSLNGDTSVLKHKGYNHGEKGTIRPAQTFILRALGVSSIMFPVGTNLYKPVVDLITAHDPIELPDSIFESHLRLGSILAPKCWVIAKGDDKNNQKIRSLEINTKIIELEAGSIIDPFTGKPYSTSGIIARLVEN